MKQGRSRKVPSIGSSKLPVWPARQRLTRAALQVGLAFVPLVALAGPSLPPGASSYMEHSWMSALNAPYPELSGLQLLSLLNGGIGPVIPTYELTPDLAGFLGTYNPGGGTSPSPTKTATNAFFASLGTNGRTCGTCHQPASGMSINRNTILARFIATAGQDPLFAPVDGADCPKSVPAGHTRPSYYGGRLGEGKDMVSAHSLLLNRGVFRIFLPVPATIPLTFGPNGPDPRSNKPTEFSVEVVNDPNGCNTDPVYAFSPTDPTTRVLSNYRRPLVSTNLKYVTTITAIPGFAGPGGNIMWDGREPTLSSQAIDATLGHAQAINPPSDAATAQMVDFETYLFSAQSYDQMAGSLMGGGATGGPQALAAIAPAQAGPLTNTPVFSQFNAWSNVVGQSPDAARKRSIYRGQQIYNTRQFTIANIAGFNDAAGLNPNPFGTCGTCHSTLADGSDSFPNAQHALGVGGQGADLGGPAPARDLPIFKVTCDHPVFTDGSEFLGYGPDGKSRPIGFTVFVNDLGRAGVSGLCEDIGKFTVAPLRGLASHPPYFHDGSAQSMMDVVNFYDQRFHIGYTPQDKQDLVNFLNAL